MKKIAKNMLTLGLGLALYALPAYAQTTEGVNSQAQASRISIIAERQTVRFVAPDDGATRRLVVTNRQGDVLYDSGFTSAATLEWAPRNAQGQAVENGLYHYILTVKSNPAANPVVQEGQVFVERANSLDRILRSSVPQVSTTAEGALLKIMVVDDTNSLSRSSSSQSRGRISAGQVRTNAVVEALGNNTFPVNGNTGVGTTSPTELLDVTGDTDSAGNGGQIAVHSVFANGAELYSHSNGATNVAANASQLAFRAPVVGLYKSRGTQASPSAVQSADSIGYINIGGHNGTGYVTGASIWSQARSNWSGADNSADLQFYVTPTGATAPVRGLYLDSTGNVGIGGGALTPFNTLNIAGTLSVGQGAYNTPAPSYGAIIQGSVGIGTYAPNAFKLQVAGSVGPDTDNGGSLGNSTRRWTAVYSSTGYIQTSDARLKQRVANLNYGLREVMRLRPISFQWKDQKDASQHLGLLAQEVEQVIPEAIHRDANSSAPLGMRYDNLVPVVIKAVQEQQTTITSLQTENAELKQQNAALEARLSALEKKMGTRKARR